MWRSVLCIIAALSIFVSDAVADRRQKSTEAQQLEKFSDRVAREGNELFLRLKDGPVVIRKDSRPSIGFYDCDGNVWAAYTFLDFIDPWFVIHEQHYEGAATVFINRDTGEEEAVDGHAQFSPDKTRFIASGYPGVTPCYQEIWKLSRSGLAMEWQTSCDNLFRWADSTTVEETGYGAATLKHDGTSWKCSGSSHICGTEVGTSPPSSGEQRDSDSGETVHIERPGNKSAQVPAEHLDGSQALVSAVLGGDLEEVKALLDNGANVNAHDRHGWTPLTQAAVQANLDAVNLLLERDADVNVKTKKGRTALMWAVDRGQTEIVRALLQKGADTNAADEQGRTALMLAAEKGRAEIVQALLKKGADVNAGDEEGQTPLSVAATRNHLDVVKLLRDWGAETNVMVAARLGDLNEVQRLLIKGADVNAKNADGATALIEASGGGHLEVVQLLLEKGADVNAENKYAWTALLVAAWKGHLGVVRALLDHGADVSAKNDACQTALETAEDARREEIVKLLRDCGAK